MISSLFKTAVTDVEGQLNSPRPGRVDSSLGNATRHLDLRCAHIDVSIMQDKITHDERNARLKRMEFHDEKFRTLPEISRNGFGFVSEKGA